MAMCSHISLSIHVFTKYIYNHDIILCTCDELRNNSDIMFDSGNALYMYSYSWSTDDLYVSAYSTKVWCLLQSIDAYVLLGRQLSVTRLQIHVTEKSHFHLSCKAMWYCDNCLVQGGVKIVRHQWPWYIKIYIINFTDIGGCIKCFKS